MEWCHESRWRSGLKVLLSRFVRFANRIIFIAGDIRRDYSVSTAACASTRLQLYRALRWRHRFLTLPAAAKANYLEGIVEADETFFPVSCKGQRQLDRPPRKRGKQIHMRGTGKDQVPVLIVRDRSGATADFMLDAIDKKAIEPPLRTVLEKDVIFCSDGAAVYRSVARSLGITHRPVNLAAGVRVIAGVYHIQNVNAYHSRLKQWMKRFHGVATRYLENYLGWFRWLDQQENLSSPIVGLQAALGRENQFQLLTNT